MFAAPPVIEAEVFTRMPPEIGHPDRQSIWTQVQVHGASTPTFLEGPSFDRDGNLWVVDIPWGRLLKVTPDGAVSVGAEYDGEPNGLAFHKDGRAFIADYRNGVMVFDPGKGTVEPHLLRDRLERFKGLNDLTFASNGDLYFTDQGQTGLSDPTGRLFRLRPNGELDLVLGGIPSPNGLVLNHEENIIFLAVTRDNAIWRVPLTPEGHASKVGVFIRLSGGGGPDGMAIDEAGNIAVCHVGLGVTWLFSALGEPLYRIQSPEGILTTNCAFGGPDNRTLFITESKSQTILRAELDTPGWLLFGQS